MNKLQSKDKLYIKNFGPLKDVSITLDKINVLIGSNGSGKSVLAKIITIVLDMKTHMINEDEFFKKFQDYNIDFLTNDTIIKFYVKDDIIFEIRNKEIYKLNDKFDPIVQEMIRPNQENIIKAQKLTTQYIPAERNLISLFSNSLSTFVVSGVPLPKFLLHFSSHYEKARQEIRELDFLDMRYVNNGKDIIYYSKDEYLDLEHSSSGVQSALPLYLATKYFVNKHRSIIIEEPEQNLFPKAQVDTIKYIIEQVDSDNDLFVMTHSPYVLSALNILLYAHKVANLNDESRKEVSEVYAENIWINPDEFSAYFLENGIARDIKSSNGMINDNEIDDISQNIAGEFDDLLDIFRNFKNDK